MRIDLNVPYDDKDLAKKLGAKWDGQKKRWYIVDQEDLEPFMRWMPENLKRAHCPVAIRRDNEMNKKHFRSI